MSATWYRDPRYLVPIAVALIGASATIVATWLGRTPSGEPATAAEAEPEALLLETFDDNEYGWPVELGEPWSSRIAGGALTLESDAPPGAVEWQYLDLTFEDLAAELTLRLPSREELETHYAGLILRHRDGSFYFFAINNAGGWAFGARVAGASPPWRFLREAASPALHPGAAPNRLRVEARGSSFALSANGRDLETVRDASLAGPGGIGVLSISPNRAVFDELAVYEPS